MIDTNDDFKLAVSLICNAEKKSKDPEDQDLDDFLNSIGQVPAQTKPGELSKPSAGPVVQIPLENEPESKGAFEDIETVLMREIGQTPLPKDEPIKAKSPTALEVPERTIVTTPLEVEKMVGEDAPAISRKTEDMGKGKVEYIFMPSEIANIILAAHDPIVLQCTARLLKPYSQAGDFKLLTELERPKNENPTPEEVERSKGISTSLNYLRMVVKGVLRKKIDELSKTKPEIATIKDSLVLLYSQAIQGEKYSFVDEVINHLMVKTRGRKAERGETDESGNKIPVGQWISSKPEAEQLHENIIKEKEKGLGIVESTEANKLKSIKALTESNTSETIAAESPLGKFLASIFSQMTAEKAKKLDLDFMDEDYPVKVKISSGPTGSKGSQSIFIDTNILPKAFVKHLKESGLSPEQIQIIGKKFLIIKNPDGSFRKDIKETIKLLKKMKHPGTEYLEGIYTKSAFEKATLVIRGKNV